MEGNDFGQMCQFSRLDLGPQESQGGEVTIGGYVTEVTILAGLAITNSIAQLSLKL